MIVSVIPNIILHPVWFLFPVFTTDVLMRNADFGGYLLAVTGVGGFLAALFMASFGFVFTKGKVVLGAAVTSAITAILFAFSHWMALAFVVIAAMAFSQAVFRTTRGTLIQTLAPDRLRGRLTSLQSLDRGFLVGCQPGRGIVVGCNFTGNRYRHRGVAGPCSCVGLCGGSGARPQVAVIAALTEKHLLSSDPGSVECHCRNRCHFA